MNEKTTIQTNTDLEIAILRRLFVQLNNRFSPSTKGHQVINETKAFVEVLCLEPERELQILKILDSLEQEITK